ncbi:acetolactate synthase small subunit [Helicobacter monodelphidis]|uniref:acetolactate synthase small subunit n=1 Tax=Helicobacter sp. 15-1451 TaxID=2004995 RepID=UPI000DCE55D3|nr:acetolactate synthase small subunit [Helicobacter sp. 15-1451]RAX58010.1 acetolactate synthase small subunit [Helicobacter sp. 15-1451]
MQQRQVISITAINESSVLSRISGLFAGRGYNIESLSVAPIPESDLSHITLATSGDSKVLEQIIKQLHKLIPVLTVTQHSVMVEKEMALIKFSADTPLAEIEALARSFGGEIAAGDSKQVILVATRSPARINDLIDLAKRFKPKEIVRSGVVAMERN